MSDFIEVKTTELTGSALDWAVASSLNGSHLLETVFPTVRWGERFSDAVLDGRIKSSSDWNQCGVLIDEYGIEFKLVTDATIEAYSYVLSENRVYGRDHREAACRLIAMELGETVKVPTELVNNSVNNDNT